MPDFTQWRDRAQRAWSTSSQQKKLLILGGAAAGLALAFGAYEWSHYTKYSLVYSGLSPRMGGDVIAALQKAGVPYRLENGGNLIEVPKQDAARVRLQLAEQGLPARASSAIWEDLQNEKLGTSSFIEHTTYLRAVEANLAKDVMSIHGVASAHVNLAIPQQTPFLETMPKPKAAVTVRLMPGVDLTHAQVFGITHLVASSVPGLEARSVTVVDQNGQALTSKSHGAAGSTVLQLQQRVESTYRKQIVDLLAPLVGGPQNLRVVVDANLDQSQQQQSSVTYGLGHVVTAAVRSSSRRGDQTAQAVGIPGALSNQPPGSPSAPIVAPTGSATSASLTLAEIQAMIPLSEKNDQHYHYVLDKTVGFRKDAPWRLNTLSVSVVINGTAETVANGTVGAGATKPVAPTASSLSAKQQKATAEASKQPKYQPVGYSQATLAALQRMVANAIHASAPQGTVTIDAIPFRKPIVHIVPWWKRISPWEIWRNIEWFLFALIVLLFIRRPMHDLFTLRVGERHRRLEAEAAALAAQKRMEGEVERKQQDVPILMTESGATLDLSGVSEGHLEDNIRIIKELIRTDTARAVEVIREWIGYIKEENG